MEHVENLLKTALGEIERLLMTKTVVGKPIVIEGNTIVPLVAIGFAFGGGGGDGEDQKRGKGSGGGTGGGGGVRPVAVVIVDQSGNVRVEPICMTASVVEKLGEAVARVVQTSKSDKKENG